MDVDETFDNGNKEMMVSQNEVATSSVQAAVTAEIQSGLVIAKRFPRDEDNSRALILRTCKRPRFAACVEYSKPIGGKRITGVSIRAAEVAGNSWGNLKTMVSILFDDEGQGNTPGRRIINISAMDLQTNTSWSTQAVIEKTVERSTVKRGQKVYGNRVNSYGKTTYIVKPTADEFEVKVAATTSKLLRNNILRLIPEDIKEEMVETARETIADKAAKDPDGERKKIIDAFSSLNIMPTDLKEYLGKDPAKLSPAEIVDLGAIWKTIKDGQANWSDYIEEAKRKRNEKTTKPVDDGKNVADKIAAKADNVTEPNAEPPKTETTAPAKPQVGEFKDIQEVVDNFRAAADIESLKDMRLLIAEVDPAFKEEARAAFDQAFQCLTQENPPQEQPKQDDDALVKKLSVISVGINADDKAGIAKELFGDGRKTGFRVRELDKDQLHKLKGILESRGLFQEEE